jgi:GMP synthase (glutamine-hydrolysing)
MQYICHTLGGRVAPMGKSEYGTLRAVLDENSDLFFSCPGERKVLMSHGDTVESLPEGFAATARTERCPVAACENRALKIYGVQFHHEVENTNNGTEIIRNFLYSVCGARGDYSMADYLQRQISAVRERVGNKQVLLGLSGGVDSSVCAALLSKAIPGQLTCIYVDHGFMRKNETEEIKEVFGKRKLQLVCVDARERLLKRLAGVPAPEDKRKIIGDEFARVFEDEAKKCSADFLAQGTI